MEIGCGVFPVQSALRTMTTHGIKRKGKREGIQRLRVYNSRKVLMLVVVEKSSAELEVICKREMIELCTFAD